MSRFSGQKTKYFLSAFLLGASFLFCAPKALAWHTVSTYEKLTNGTLTAAEWNNLLYSTTGVAGAGDFVTTWLPASMNGPLGIATSAPASGLEVNGLIRGLTLQGPLAGTVNANNVSAGQFGVNTGGGIYSFPGNVGIGTTNPGRALHIYKNGSPALRLESASSNQGIEMITQADKYSWLLGAQYNVDGAFEITPSAAVNGTTFSTPVAVFKQSGNVGIGTINPTQKLHVYGGDLLISAVNDTARLRLSTSGGAVNRDWMFFSSASDGSFGIYDVSGGARRMTIYTNGNVGIGPNTPTAKLDVAGSLRATSALISGLGGSSASLVLADSSGNLYATSTSIILPEGTVSLPSGAAGQTLRYTGSAWTANSTLYNNGTSVGIGTTNPAYKLHVLGTGIYIQSGGDYYSRLFGEHYTAGEEPISLITSVGSASNNSVIIGGGTSIGNTATQISFYTASNATTTTGTERLRISSSGNVGIGTTNPLTKLDIMTSGANGLLLNQDIGTPTNSSRLFFKNSSSVFAIVGTNSNLLFNHGATIGSQSGTNVMAINTSGNVGIGSTAPAAKLDLPTGFFRALAGTVSGLGSSGNVVVMADNSGNLFSTSTAAIMPQGTVSLPGGSSGQTLRYNGSSWVANSTLYNNGSNVGIGTTAPGARLEIAGSSIIGNSSSANQTVTIQGTNAGTDIVTDSNQAATVYLTNKNGADNTFADIRFKDAGGNSVAGITGVFVNNANNQGDLVFTARASGGNLSEKLRILGSGNVGIGTTAPGYKLDVFGSVHSTESVIAGGSYDIRMSRRLLGNNLYQDSDYNFRTVSSHASYGYAGIGTNWGSLNFYATPGITTTADAVVTPVPVMSLVSGNVGIGSTAPAAKLDLPTGFFRALAGTVSGLGSSGNVVVMADNSGNLFATSSSSFISNNSLDLWAGSKSGNIYSNNSGNVGIGTTTPAATLEIKGAVAAAGTALKVTSDGNAEDKVFHFTGNDAAGYNMVMLQTGKVGIGTTNPGKKLVIAGASSELQIYSDSDISTIDSRVLGGTTNKWLSINPSGGNVGIGTTAPLAPLNVMTSSSVDGALGQQWGYPAGAANTQYNLRLKQVVTLGVVRWVFDQTNNNTFYDNVLVLDRGNVGIGSTAPSVKLDIPSGYFRALGGTVSGLGSGGNVLVMADNSGNLFSTSTASFLSSNSGWTLNGTNVYKTNTSGNVGIGTTNPGDKLEIVDGGDQLRLGSGISGLGSSPIIELQDGTVTPPTQIYGYGTSLRFRAGSSDVLSIISSGNVGIGTTNPAHKLDVNGNVNAYSLSMSGYNILRMPSNNPEVGPWNPIWNVVGTGKPLYFDEEFASGSNGVSVYNNAGGTAVTMTRLTGQTGVPNSTGVVLKISYDGVGPVSPDFGGVYQSFTPAPNRTYVQRFRAKVPVGKYLTIHENPQGDNSTSYWLTNTAGTGKWEDYIRISHAGNTGTFSSSGHIAVAGGSGAFDWYLSSINVYEVNTPITTSPNTWLSTQTFSGGAIFPNNGVWNSAGNLGIGSVTPGVKLDLPAGYFRALGGTVSGLGTAGNVLVMADNSGNLFATSTASFLSSNSGWTLNGTNVYKTNTSGNVGIGTTAPESKLFVIGQGRFGSSNVAYMEIYGNGSSARIGQNENSSIPISIYGAGDVQINLDSNNNETIRAFSVRTNAMVDGTELFRVQETGNVGIGTTSPAAKLQINGSIPSLLLTYYGDSRYQAGVQAFYDANHRMSLTGFNGTEVLGQYQTNTALMYGNVGIGTTSPRTKQEISFSSGGSLPNISWVGQTIFRSGASSDAFASGLALIAYQNKGAILTGGGSGFGVSTYDGINAPTSRLFIESSNGNVGIGSTAPAVKLDLPSGYFRALGGTVSGLGSSGNVLVMADNSGNLFATSTLAIIPNPIPGGSSGQTLRHNGSSWIANSNLYNNGTNVGIGTTNPSYKLDVSGDIRSTGKVYANNKIITSRYGNAGTYDSTQVQGIWSIGDGWQIDTTNNNFGNQYGLVYAHTNAGTGAVNKPIAGWGHQILFVLNGSYKASVSLDSGNAYFAGNVGIGSTAPSVKLDIPSGYFRALGGTVSGLGSSGNVLVMADNSGNLFATSTLAIIPNPIPGGSSGQTLRHNGSSWIANSNLYNNGTNVGIGITNPTSRLQIISGGGISFAGRYKTYETVYNVNTATPATLVDDTGSAFNVNKSYRVKAVIPGTGSETGATAVFRGNGTTFTLIKNFEAGLGSNHIEFYLDSNIPKVRLYNHTTLYGVSVLTEEIPNKSWAFGPEISLYSNTTGSVGIGSVTPGTKLDVSTSFRANSATITGLGATGNVVVMADNTGLLYTSPAASSLLWSGTTGGNIWNANSGNVGIGITDPKAKLHISGTADNAIIVDERDWNNKAMIFFREGGGTTYGGYVGYNAAIDGLQFNTLDNGTEKLGMFIARSSGNVGIGTVSPGSYKLYVNGNTNIAGNLNVTGTSTAAAFVGPVVGTINATNVSAGQFGVTTGGGNFTFPGNLGIGTTVAGSKLHVLGITQITDGVASADTAQYGTFGVTRPASATTLSYIAMTRAGQAVRAMGIDSSNNWIFGAPTSGSQAINTVWMSINGSGNVGIGTAPAAYKLKVGGDVAITGTLLTQTGSDFAEEFKAKAALLPGTVVVMGDEGYKSVKPCSKSYDKTVVGIVSDNPSIIAGRTDADNKNPEKVVVAMMGVVKVKVTAMGGSIERGDLLTTSSVSGYAMKASSAKQGTIIGKALEDLEGDRGEIRVLVNLQ